MCLFHFADLDNHHHGLQEETQEVTRSALFEHVTFPKQFCVSQISDVKAKFLKIEIKAGRVQSVRDRVF